MSAATEGSRQVNCFCDLSCPRASRTLATPPDPSMHCRPDPYRAFCTYWGSAWPIMHILVEGRINPIGSF